MKVSFQGTDYYFWFEYRIIHIDGGEPFQRPKAEEYKDDTDSLLANRAWLEVHRDVADCFISTSPETEEPLAAGRAVRHYQDTPNRLVAREAALAKALQSLTEDHPVKAETAREGKVLDRERRVAFWNVYFAKCRASDPRMRVRRVAASR
jgi:hypothetical protein